MGGGRRGKGGELIQLDHILKFLSHMLENQAA